MYSSQITIHTVVIDALNNAVPEGYKSTGKLIGAKVYISNGCPQTILDNHRQPQPNHFSEKNAEATSIQQRMEPPGANHDTLLSTRGVLHDNNSKYRL